MEYMNMEKLGVKVSLSGTEQKGKITLEYGSQEELQRLWDMLGE